MFLEAALTRMHLSTVPLRRMRVLPAWLLPPLLGAGSLLAALAVSLTPPASGPIAVLFPPWWSSARSVMAASAAGPVLRFGASFVVIVMPRVSHPFNVLRQQGAWALLDPLAFGGCGKPAKSGVFQ
jgi:hypothetical protein